MPLNQLIVGQQVVSDGAVSSARGGRTGETITSDLHGRYFEQAARRNIFSAASQAATAWSVALNTTYTGLVLSNPAGSGVNLVPIQLAFVAQVAPAAVATIGLMTGFLSAGLTVHTTPLLPVSTFIGSPKGTGLVDAAATLPITPVWANHLFTVFTTLSSQVPGLSDIGGLFIVPPGGFIAIGALTAVTGLASMSWEEVVI